MIGAPAGIGRRLVLPSWPFVGAVLSNPRFKVERFHCIRAGFSIVCRLFDMSVVCGMGLGRGVILIGGQVPGGRLR